MNDDLKNFLTKNHPEPGDINNDLASKTWARIEQQRPLRQKFYVGLSMAAASLAMVIGVSVNLRSTETLEATKALNFDEESFVVDSYSDLDSLEESIEDYAFGF